MIRRRFSPFSRKTRHNACRKSQNKRINQSGNEKRGQTKNGNANRRVVHTSRVYISFRMCRQRLNRSREKKEEKKKKKTRRSGKQTSSRISSRDPGDGKIRGKERKKGCAGRVRIPVHRSFPTLVVTLHGESTLSRTPSDFSAMLSFFPPSLFSLLFRKQSVVKSVNSARRGVSINRLRPNNYPPPPPPPLYGTYVAGTLQECGNE